MVMIGYVCSFELCVCTKSVVNSFLTLTLTFSKV